MHDTVLTSPPVCGLSDLVLAHRHMQQHRGCRIDRCGWKWIAYRTLVHYGRIAPQQSSPRERAHAGGITFPANDIGTELPDDTPELPTLQQVLDGLAALATPPSFPTNPPEQ